MRTGWARSEIQGRDIVWLLDFAYAGQTFRLSSRPITVPSDDGDIPYLGNLGECVVTSSVDLFSDSPTPPKASVEILFPVDVPALVLAGHRLGSARVEISQVRAETQDAGASADDWEDRRVVLRGRVNDPEWGTTADPIRFTVAQDLYTDRSVIPDADAVVSDADQFYSVTAGEPVNVLLSAADIGIAYPTIIGQPGLDPITFGGWITGSQALWANTQSFLHQLIIAGHRVAATSVMINCDDEIMGQWMPVSHVYDARGREVAIIGDVATPSGNPVQGLHSGLEETGGGVANDMPTVYQKEYSATLNVYVGWPFGGGAIGRNGQAIRGAGDVLEWMLQRTSLAVDFGKVAAASAFLNRFNIDAAIEATCSPMEWILHHLSPILPMSLTVGPAGVYPVVWRYDAGPDDAVAHLDADSDPRISIGPTVTADTSRITNQFTLDYARSRRTGGYAHRARIGGTYEAVEGYASGQLRGGSNQPGGTGEPCIIKVSAVTPGPAGRVRVIMNDGGGNPPVITDSVATNTVTIGYTIILDTIDEIVTAINTSTLITAQGASGLAFSQVAWDLDITLVYEDRSQHQDYYCAISQRRYEAEDGTGIFSEAMESDVIYDRNTADAVLAWKARALALEHTTTAALAPFGDYGWIRNGDPVLVTRTALGIVRKLFRVEETEEGADGMIGFRLRHTEDPMRDPVS